MAVVGFDFGSSLCYVAVARQGGVETIDNDYSDRKTPTLVGYGTTRRSMGVSAKNQLVTNPKNTVSGFRNVLGLSYSDPITKNEFKNSPLVIEELCERDSTVGFKVDYLGESQLLSAQQVSTAMLSHLKAISENALKTKVTDCVISVPSYFTDSQRRALLDSSTAAGLNCLRLMNDTTAAGLAYGIYKQDLPEQKEAKDPSRNVVFVDLGYSSLQACVCAFNKGKLKVLAKVFNNHVGGKYFDECLVQHFAAEFKQRYKIDSLAKPKHRLRLVGECEKLKKLLSANNTKIPINIECFVEEKDVSGRLDRDEFVQLCSAQLEQIRLTLGELLGKAKLKVEDVHSVEIVGGSCRIPAVKQIIMDTFQKPLSTSLNMDEAVARGCALQCAMLSPAFRVRDFSVADIQPYNINVFWEPQARLDSEQDEVQSLSGDMVLFKEGDAINFSKVLTLYRSEKFDIKAYYADPPCANSFIGKFTFNKVVPTSAGKPSKLKLKARINIHGIFSFVNAYIVETTTVELPSVTAPTVVKESGTQQQSVAEEEDRQGSGGNEGDGVMESSVDRQPINGKEETMEMTDGADTPASDRQPPGDISGKPDEGIKTDPSSSAEDTVDKGAQTTSATGEDTKKSEEPEAKKAKKQTKHIDVPIEAVTFSLSKAQLDTVLEKEGKMAQQDKLQMERANAKNSVEEYIYDMRDKLETTLQEFISEKDREPFSSLLMATEDWLYEEGEDESKQTYLDKLEELKKFGNPVVNRAKEFEGRHPAFEQLAHDIVHYEKIVVQHSEGSELYSHIETEEMKKVQECVQKKREWMHQQQQKLSNLPKCNNPPVTIAQISAEHSLLTTTCKPIVTKPKPKVEPPKEVPKEDQSKEEESTEASPQEGEKEQPMDQGSPMDTNDNTASQSTDQNSESLVD